MIMALEGKVYILQALDQLLFVCYFVLIFPFIVHNVSAIINQKGLLDIRTAVTNPIWMRTSTSMSRS
jgi:hypothetical protein